MKKNRHCKRVLETLIRENSIKKFVEIGVGRSTTLTHILKKTNISEYWAIDPWLPYTGGSSLEGMRDVKEPKLKWESWHIKACRRMLYYPQLRVLRTDSVAASKMFPDEYFDFVYIDGDHRYEYVVLDIKSWLPKVKKRGILGGHDYGNEIGVNKAVDEYFSGVELLDGFVWIKRV